MGLGLSSTGFRAALTSWSLLFGSRPHSGGAHAGAAHFPDDSWHRSLADSRRSHPLRAQPATRQAVSTLGDALYRIRSPDLREKSGTAQVKSASYPTGAGSDRTKCRQLSSGVRPGAHPVSQWPPCVSTTTVSGSNQWVNEPQGGRGREEQGSTGARVRATRRRVCSREPGAAAGTRAALATAQRPREATRAARCR